ncbi:hypothetical protein PR002_g3668 [Phytophthora rubi]|uniref:Protein kinase domain-containing protein n=1 Tax=Phytophthora rubi TaxID=129364 RepID=A0A6A3NH61_9STRA|nr:hypothetical protein PR002_g3668 [Phytophthora rubi]
MRLSVLIGSMGWGLAQSQTITFRSLEASSGSLPTNSSFVFDGTNSDIAQQLYNRHKAGDTGAALDLTSVPAAVTKRLNRFNIRFNDLPGLVQRAVLWDSGFAISPDNDPVQIWPMGDHSMADIAIPKADVANVDCTFLNCSQLNDETAYSTKFCTGYQILNASRCVVDVFEDAGAGSFLGTMWSTGGDPDMTPELRLRDHTWTQDIKEFGGNVTFSVYAVHTVPSGEDPAWDVCPSGYGALTLEDEFAQSSGFNKLLLLPILLSVVAVLALGWFFWRLRAKKLAEKLTYEYGGVSPHYWSGDTPDMVVRPMVVTSQLTSQFSTLSSHYESVGSNQTLKILLGSEHLQGRHIPFESLVFEKAISKGASGEVWICEYNGHKVAAKRLLQTKHQRAHNVQAFAEEIELSASLTHPNIVEFIGVAWNTLNNLVMVMELLPMGSLQQYLRENGEFLSWSNGKIAPYADAVTENGGMPKPFYVLQDVMAGRLRPSFSKDCPPWIKRIGLACLALDPRNRPTAHELVQELQDRGGKEAAECI